MLKALWNRFVELKNGCGLPFLTKEKPCYGANSAFDYLELRRKMDLDPTDRLYPYVMNPGQVNQQLGLMTKNKKFLPLIAVVSILFSSCGSPTTRPDPAPAYSDGGYRSVEMSMCGKYFFGVGGCHYASGTAATDRLGVQGFAKGEIAVFSDLCHVDFKTRYGENEFISIALSDLLDTSTLQRNHSCTLRVIVSPDPLKGSEEKIYPRVGEIYVEVRSPGIQGLPLPIADQVRLSDQPDQKGLSIPMQSAGEYQQTRCADAPIQQGFVPPLLTFEPIARVKSCKYQYSVRTQDGKKYSQVFMRNVYAANTVLLARPKITREADKLCIESDPSVTTFIAIDSEWTNKTKLCAKGKGPFKVRVFTTKRNYFEIVK